MKTPSVILNGTEINPVDIGGGDKQIKSFQLIEKYTQTHKLKIKDGDFASKFPNRHDNVIMGEDTRYQIIAVQSFVPGVSFPLADYKYQSYLRDKKTDETSINYGTIAHYVWDLLHELKDKQK